MTKKDSEIIYHLSLAQIEALADRIIDKVLKNLLIEPVRIPKEKSYERELATNYHNRTRPSRMA